MKFSVTCKYKIWILIAVVVIAAGFALFGIFGFNQTADYKDCFSVSVKVDANIGKASEILEESSENYLKEKNLNYDRVEVIDDGGELVYYFTSSVKDVVDVSELENSVKQALSVEDILSGLNVTATVDETVSFVDNHAATIAIAGGIVLVIAFIYALIVEKLSGAVAAIASAVISGLTFFALMGITRIPTLPFMAYTLPISVLFGFAYSIVMVNRFNSSAKTVAGEKTSAFDIADKESMQSLLKCTFTTGAMIVFAIALLALGSSLVKILGLQIIMVAISSLFSAFAFSGLVWASIKGSGKSEYVSANSIDKE